jgi:hypothetical protein
MNNRFYRNWPAWSPRRSVIATLVFALFGPGVCLTARAQLTTIAYDGFNYGAGTLAGQNGGTGWSTAWVNDYTSGGSLYVSATGKTYTGLTTSGGSVAWHSGGNGISENSRTLPLVDSGVVYILFLGQFGSSSGGGAPNMRLFDSGTLTGGFGGNGGTYGADVSILDASLNAAADGSSSSTAKLLALNLIVGRIDYQNNDTMLWVNPNLSTFNFAAPPAANASYAGLAPAFNDISLLTKSPGSFDEVTVMSEATPEPAAASLLVLGAGLALAGWRRRKSRAVKAD